MTQTPEQQELTDAALAFHEARVRYLAALKVIQRQRDAETPALLRPQAE